MRTLRTATPIPQPSYDDTVCPEILPSRRFSSASSMHLPTLREGSMDCNALSRIVPPVFAPSELGKTEIIALVGSPSHPRRGQLFKKSTMERRRRSQEISRLPNLICGENVEPDSAHMPASPEWVERLRRPEHYELTRAVSHPVLSHSTLAARTSGYSNSKSLPRLDSAEPSRTLNHSAELRRHIQQQEIDYDLYSTKAVILERFLNSQS